MPRRTNPWPAYVDLFSALLIASFAGFIMLSGAYQHEVSGYRQREKETEKMREEASSIIGRVKKSLDQDNAMSNIVRSCGDDTCIDLYIHFDQNKDEINDTEELNSINRTCGILKGALDGLSIEQRKDLEITIEGHTDSTQPLSVTDPRLRYRLNWDLSARRATSVLYVFQQCGLKPPDYQIVAIGYADSVPLCHESTQDCLTKNRRTTLRLRADTRSIEARLKKLIK
jgi:outer membrane protein OmpA-like peptidoglycan-associated protein